jgi:hypothetical protein
VLDPAHVERAVGRNDEWQVEHEPYVCHAVVRQDL